MYNNSSKKAFTLVELIIVIAIIAILAVTAFLLLTKWLSKARDASRSSNLANIENSLQISLTENSSLPKPDNYVLIYASGTSNVIGYQGSFGEGVKDSLGNINSAPKDGDDYFTYYLNSDLNKYQIAGFMENEISYNPNVVSAVDYSSRYINLRGDKLGLLTDNNNSPLQSLGLTGLDILNTTNTYHAYLDKTTNVSGTGKSLVSMLTINNKSIAKYDTGLVGYWDMETTITSGGLLMLKDLSTYGNNGTCYNGSGNTVSCGQKAGGPQFVDGNKGKAMLFDGIDDFIKTPNIVTLLGSGIEFTMIVQVSISKMTTRPVIAGSSLCKNGGYLQIYSGDTSDKFMYSYWIDNLGTLNAVGSSKDYDYNKIYTISSRFNQSKQNQTIFINGNLISSVARTAPFGLDPVGGFYLGGIGDVSPSSGRMLNGTIDEVRVYNRALSDDEVKAFYNTTN